MSNELNIPFKKENFIRCLCPTCPVQENSVCAREKMMITQEKMHTNEDIKPQDYPGMYCTNGKTECEDIDTNKDCVCPDCGVYKEFDLENAKPDFLYCKDGKAKK